MQNSMRLALVAVLMLIGTTAAQAQLTVPDQIAKSPNPELIGMLTKKLKITPDQAIGAAGALFGVAKTKLSPENFTKLANVVPGMDGLLGASPKPSAAAAGGAATDMLGSLGSMIPANLGSITQLAGVFQTLGLSPDQIMKFVPLMSKYVKGKGGADLAGLLSGALK